MGTQITCSMPFPDFDFWSCIQRCCLQSTDQTRTCLKLESAPKQRCGFISMYLYLSVFLIIIKEQRKSSKFVPVKMAANLSLHYWRWRPASTQEASLSLRYQVCCTSVLPLPVQCCSCAGKRSVLQRTVYTNKWSWYMTLPLHDCACVWEVGEVHTGRGSPGKVTMMFLDPLVTPPRDTRHV